MSRDKILKESLKLIRKNGLENFSKRKLAQVLDIKPASIYYYFKTKDEILNSIYQWGLETFHSFEEEDFNSIEDYLFWFYKSVHENRMLFVFIMQYRNNPFLTEESKKLFKKYTKTKIESFRQKFKDDNYNTDHELNQMIIKGIVIELAHEKELKLDDEKINKLVTKTVAAMKEE